MRRSSLRLGAIVLSLAGLVQFAAAQDLVTPRFVEETASSGVQSVYSGEWQYMVGGGVATFDCNSDGFPDMFLAGGEGTSTFYRNASTKGGALKFVAEASGLEQTSVTGAYPLDIDSDGIEDVVLLRVGESEVMRGLGNCKFERANEAWTFDGGDEWWTAFAAIWERGAAWPTLALGAYIDRTQDIEPWGSCTDNWLERPKAAGAGFDAPVPLKPSFCALSMLFTDWDRSGTPGLRVSNDREYYLGGTEQLWRLDPGKPPALYGAPDGWKPLKIWGMGIASADITGDGYPDYFITSMADNKLQTLAGPAQNGVMPPVFKDIAFALGATAHRPSFGADLRPSTAWHAQFEDVNNDGRLDLFVAKGNVDQMPDFATADPNNLLVQKADGKFVDVAEAAGVASIETSRGAAMPDFNLDGLLDLVVVNRRTTAQVWRNVTPDAGHWIDVRLSQPAPNTDAIGALLEVKVGDLVNTREVTVGGGHVSGQIGFWHFGLGSADAAELRVTWPDGSKGDWISLAAGQFYVVSHDGNARPWSP